VVLHGAPRDSALAIAERIRSAFAERAAVIDGVHVAATVSIGLVLHEGPPVAFSELLWKADQVLYRAKERGRNRVELLGPDYFAGGNENSLSGRAMAPAVRSVA
jgi:diguanylate cyclase (GGDEF)-like protein